MFKYKLLSILTVFWMTSFFIFRILNFIDDDNFESKTEGRFKRNAPEPEPMEEVWPDNFQVFLPLSDSTSETETPIDGISTIKEESFIETSTVNIIDVSNVDRISRDLLQDKNNNETENIEPEPEKVKRTSEIFDYELSKKSEPFMANEAIIKNGIQKDQGALKSLPMASRDVQTISNVEYHPTQHEILAEAAQNGEMAHDRSRKINKEPNKKNPFKSNKKVDEEESGDVYKPSLNKVDDTEATDRKYVKTTTRIEDLVPKVEVVTLNRNSLEDNIGKGAKEFSMTLGTEESVNENSTKGEAIDSTDYVFKDNEGMQAQKLEITTEVEELVTDNIKNSELVNLVRTIKEDNVTKKEELNKEIENTDAKDPHKVSEIEENVRENITEIVRKNSFRNINKYKYGEGMKEKESEITTEVQEVNSARNIDKNNEDITVKALNKGKDLDAEEENIAKEVNISRKVETNILMDGTDLYTVTEREELLTENMAELGENLSMKGDVLKTAKETKETDTENVKKMKANNLVTHKVETNLDREMTQFNTVTNNKVPNITEKNTEVGRKDSTRNIEDDIIKGFDAEKDINEASTGRKSKHGINISLRNPFKKNVQIDPKELNTKSENEELLADNINKMGKINVVENIAEEKFGTKSKEEERLTSFTKIEQPDTDNITNVRGINSTRNFAKKKIATEADNVYKVKEAQETTTHQKHTTGVSLGNIVGDKNETEKDELNKTRSFQEQVTENSTKFFGINSEKSIEDNVGTEKVELNTVTEFQRSITQGMNPTGKINSGRRAEDSEVKDIKKKKENEEQVTENITKISGINSASNIEKEYKETEVDGFQTTIETEKLFSESVTEITMINSDGTDKEENLGRGVNGLDMLTKIKEHTSENVNENMKINSERNIENSIGSESKEQNLLTEIGKSVTENIPGGELGETFDSNERKNILEYNKITSAEENIIEIANTNSPQKIEDANENEKESEGEQAEPEVMKIGNLKATHTETPRRDLKIVNNGVESDEVYTTTEVNYSLSEITDQNQFNDIGDGNVAQKERIEDMENKKDQGLKNVSRYDEMTMVTEVPESLQEIVKEKNVTKNIVTNIGQMIPGREFITRNKTTDFNPFEQNLASKSGNEISAREMKDVQVKEFNYNAEIGKTNPFTENSLKNYSVLETGGSSSARDTIDTELKEVNSIAEVIEKINPETERERKDKDFLVGEIHSSRETKEAMKEMDESVTETLEKITLESGLVETSQRTEINDLHTLTELEETTTQIVQRNTVIDSDEINSVKKVVETSSGVKQFNAVTERENFVTMQNRTEGVIPEIEEVISATEPEESNTNKTSFTEVINSDFNPSSKMSSLSHMPDVTTLHDDFVEIPIFTPSDQENFTWLEQYNTLPPQSMTDNTTELPTRENNTLNDGINITTVKDNSSASTFSLSFEGRALKNHPKKENKPLAVANKLDQHNNEDLLTTKRAQQSEENELDETTFTYESNSNKILDSTDLIETTRKPISTTKFKTIFVEVREDSHYLPKDDETFIKYPSLRKIPPEMNKPNIYTTPLPIYKRQAKLTRFPSTWMTFEQIKSTLKSLSGYKTGQQPIADYEKPNKKLIITKESGAPKIIQSLNNGEHVNDTRKRKAAKKSKKQELKERSKRDTYFETPIEIDTKEPFQPKNIVIQEHKRENHHREKNSQKYLQDHHSKLKEFESVPSVKIIINNIKNPNSDQDRQTPPKQQQQQKKNNFLENKSSYQQKEIIDEEQSTEHDNKTNIITKTIMAYPASKTEKQLSQSNCTVVIKSNDTTIRNCHKIPSDISKIPKKLNTVNSVKDTVLDKYIKFVVECSKNIFSKSCTSDSNNKLSKELYENQLYRLTGNVDRYNETFAETLGGNINATRTL